MKVHKNPLKCDIRVVLPYNHHQGTFGNIPKKVLKYSSDMCNSILQDIGNYEILGKQCFPNNLKLANITPVYKKEDSTLVENYQPVSMLPCLINSLKE